MKTLLVAGGRCDITQLKNTAKHMKDSSEELYIIGIDGGMKTLKEAEIKPDIGVGDFDSVNVLDYSDTPIEKLCPEKDDTDTEHALHMAIDMNPSEIVLMGATGSRLDQTISSIELLKCAVDAGVQAVILDPTNRIRVAKGETVITKGDSFGYYVSVIPFSEDLTDLTMKGFKYEIEDFTLKKGISRCISNELASNRAVISCSGYYIVMETCDG
jgi:thiamine pyrophosphokinase